MTHRHDRTLVASGLARVEGEGAMYVRVTGTEVDEVRLDICEPRPGGCTGWSWTGPPQGRLGQ